MAVNLSQLERTTNSFSGVDIKCVFGHKIIAEVQALSYQIQREKAPIFTMGSANARAFSRGKRGIAGALVFIMFDRAALIHELGENKTERQFYSDADEEHPVWADSAPSTTGTLGTLASSTEDTVEGTTQSLDQTLRSPWYVDQIPPFDITVCAANEYGATAIMKILGVELLNEGYGVSVDDVVSEMQYTWIGRMVIPWTIVTTGTSPGLNHSNVSGSLIGQI